MAQATVTLDGLASEASDVAAYWKAARSGGGSASLYVSLLGLRPAETPEILKRVAAGLKFQAFERLQRNTQLSTPDLADLVGIRMRTLHRRKQEGRLDPGESDRLLRVTRLFAKALELFEGDPERARAWFDTPAPALGGERPLALARTELGAREVESLIDRLEQGVLT